MSVGTLASQRPARWAVVAVVLGISSSLLLTGFSLKLQPSKNHFSFIAGPAGRSWLLTPPSTWCNVTRLPDSTEFTCSMAGAAWIPLNVSEPSRISGNIEVGGPSSVWIVQTVWMCELEIELSGFRHSCPVPYDPPPWPSWNTTLSSAGTINLSALAINITSDLGVIPAANWALLVVDGQATNETATIASSVVLENP